MSLSKDNRSSLINSPAINNPPISCAVSYTVSRPTVTAMTPQHIIKMLCFMGLSLCSIIGSIFACSTSHFVVPYVPQVPQDPVDGVWSDWKEWTPCSIPCSSKEQPLGNMTRERYCNSPPPQLGGKFCEGVSQENKTCFKNRCPIPVDGQWAEWSPWSSCSETCQSPGKIPSQTRESTCSSPAPKDGGKPCDGESVNQRFCTWLTQCPVDGQWGPWYVNGACESVHKKSCALGKKLYHRQCNKPPPVSTGNDCPGPSVKSQDCWFDIGCPIGLHAPLSIEMFGNGTGMFELRWSSVPYGVVAVKYRIYLSMEGAGQAENTTIHMNVTAIPPLEVSGRDYSIQVDMTKYLQYSTFQSLVVRLSSVDYWDNESLLSDKVQSTVRAVDGQWGVWDHWSDCSTQCTSQMGQRSRTRDCDNPRPSKEGNKCAGPGKEFASCMGMERDC